MNSVDFKTLLALVSELPSNFAKRREKTTASLE